MDKCNCGGQDKFEALLEAQREFFHTGATLPVSFRVEMLKKLRGEGGMSALLGTHDCREVERRIQNGDEWAALVYKAQALQIAKGVGIMLGCFTELIDAVILTGGLANSKMLTGMVIDYLHNLCRVVILPGENEMEALALGALRILRGEEQARTFHPAYAITTR